MENFIFCAVYADDLVLISETRESLKVWNGALESNLLRVNVKKTKMMVSENAEKVLIESKFPYTVCRKDVDRNSILC